MDNNMDDRDDGVLEGNVRTDPSNCEIKDDDMSGSVNTDQPEKRLKIDGETSRTVVQNVLCSDRGGDTEKEENMDSAICAEKSESSNSEDQFFSNTGITNTAAELSATTSRGSFIKSVEKRAYRNYRRRTIESDDERTSRMSVNEEPESRPIVTTNPPSISEGSDTTKTEFAYGGSDDGDTSSEVSSSTISDSDDWTDVDTSTRNGDNSDYETPTVLMKKKPDHNWFLIKELMMREMGIGMGLSRSIKNCGYFDKGFYGSLLAVHKLELMYKLEKHDGCVNSMCFHSEGRLLASGSDDLNIVIWDWATNTPLHVVKSGHKSNVFQTKFMHLNAGSQINIVSCARDGQVRLMQISPSGSGKIKKGQKINSVGGIMRQRLAQHSRAAHKLHVSPLEPHIVLSAGEDGIVYLSDVRLDKATLLVAAKDARNNYIPLYSLQGHPLDTKELVVSGSDKFVRVYDRRKAGSNATPIYLYCPSFFHENTASSETNTKKRSTNANVNLYITCAIYNHTGSEILATYNDDDIYLFDAVTDKYDKESRTSEGFSHRYSGHRNSATFKGVSFFGPQSEFVVSGSDCGNIYIWDKKSEAIVQWMMGDEGGVVNCIESHPRFPVLATCGLDKDVKIWVPSNENEPNLKGLREAVQNNNRAQMRSPLVTEFLGTSVPLYSILGPDFLRELRRNSPADDSSAEDGDEDDGHHYGGNVCAAF